jgi:hypothetical protein
MVLPLQIKYAGLPNYQACIGMTICLLDFLIMGQLEGTVAELAENRVYPAFA